VVKQISAVLSPPPSGTYKTPSFTPTTGKNTNLPKTMKFSTLTLLLSLAHATPVEYNPTIPQQGYGPPIDTEVAGTGMEPVEVEVEEKYGDEEYDGDSGIETDDEVKYKCSNAGAASDEAASEEAASEETVVVEEEAEDPFEADSFEGEDNAAFVSSGPTSSATTTVSMLSAISIIAFLFV
jgi:hypothetical protein